MWYFTWVIGVGFAMAVGIINVLWLEAEYFSRLDSDEINRKPDK